MLIKNRKWSCSIQWTCALFKLASDPYSFYNNLVLPKSELLTSKELEKVKQNMEHLLAVTC